MTHQYPRSRFGGNPSLDLSLDLSFSLSLIRSAAACPMKLLPVAVVLVALVVLLTGATLTLQGSGPRGELEEEQEERLSYALLPFQEDEAVDGDEDVADRLSHLTTQISTPSGPIVGLVRGGIRAFLGVPYATPPVGSLRWRVRSYLTRNRVSVQLMHRSSCRLASETCHLGAHGSQCHARATALSAAKQHH